MQLLPNQNYNFDIFSDYLGAHWQSCEEHEEAESDSEKTSMFHLKKKFHK